MRHISLTINDSDFEILMNSLNSINSVNIIHSEVISNDLPQWQKDELDKSLIEIENGTIQHEDWNTVRDQLFTKYNLK